MAEVKKDAAEIPKAEAETKKAKPRGRLDVEEKKKEPLYTVDELLEAAEKLFTVSRKGKESAVPKECVVAAFRGIPDRRMTVATAQAVVKKFMEREVK